MFAVTVQARNIRRKVRALPAITMSLFLCDWQNETVARAVAKLSPAASDGARTLATVALATIQVVGGGVCGLYLCREFIACTLRAPHRTGAGRRATRRAQNLNQLSPKL